MEPTTAPVAALLITALFLVLAPVLYFLPTIVASRRGHHNRTAILMLNLFLGWTFLGWVLSLVWACSAIGGR